MTREEAIEKLNLVLESRKDKRGKTDTDIALEMAISALEKEDIYDDGEHYVTISKALYDKLNVDTCNDAISREAIINAIYKMELSNWVKEDIEKMIRQLSPVQPQPIEYEDMISREDARMMLTCEIKDGMTITEYIKMVDKRLRKLPPVTPSRRKGHWIRFEDDKGYWYGCSECKHEISKNEWGYDDFSAFCPNCGADMRGEE